VSLVIAFCRGHRDQEDSLPLGPHRSALAVRSRPIPQKTFGDTRTMRKGLRTRLRALALREMPRAERSFRGLLLLDLDEIGPIIGHACVAGAILGYQKMYANLLACLAEIGFFVVGLSKSKQRGHHNRYRSSSLKS